MMDVLLWLSGFGEAAIAVVWIPLLIWTMVAIPIFVTSRYMGRKQPALHYYAMVVLLGSLLMGFIMEPVWRGLNTFIPTFGTPELVLPGEGTNDGYFLTPPDISITTQPESTPFAEVRVPVGLVLAACVGALTLVLLFWSFISCIGLVLQVFQAKNMAKGLTPHAHPAVQRLLAKSKSHLGVQKDVKLMKGLPGIVPMTFGWRHPVVVIPEGIEKEPAVLEAVLCHELIHVKRKDYLVGVGTRFLSAIFSFHPMVWLIDRSVQTYRELSCDNELLRTHIISPLNYAHLLLRFNASPPSGYTIPMIQKKSVIKHRIKAMSEFAPSSFKIHRGVGWGALLLLLFVPAFFMACNIEAEHLEEPYVAPEGATVMEDLKMAFVMPDGWWQNGEPVRATSADLVEMITPQQLEELKKTDPAMVSGDPDDLQTSLYMFMYHNAPAAPDSLPENMEEELFYHMLTFNVHTYYDKNRLARWAKGLCGDFPGRSCDASRIPSHMELIRVLGPNETPFSEGTGFLYEVTRSELPTVAYIFYLVRDGWAYKIVYEITKNELGDEPYPPVLDTIGFME